MNDQLRQVAILIALIATIFLSKPIQATADDRPNVLFIAVDDLNDWIGCMNGHPQALTPNIDRLAARGMLFTNAHCAAPACNPSRAAISTGRMPNVTEAWSNQSESITKLHPQARHMVTAFNEAGYATAGTGKLFDKRVFNLFQQSESVNQRWSPFPKKAVEYTKQELPSKGSDNPRHVLKDSQGRQVVLPMNRMPSDRKPNDDAGESFDWSGFDLPDSDWGDTIITDWAIDRLKESRDKPLFLGVGYYRPHIPLFAPQRFFERFRNTPAQLPPYRKDDLNDLPAIGKKWAIDAVTAGLHSSVVKHNQWQAAVEAYLACVTYVDYEIGRLLDALEQSPIGDETMIVLWSDHGWQLGEKDHWGKWTGWERSTKVPLVIVPAKSQKKQFAKPGTRCDTPVGLIDLYPTFVEFCGIEGPPVLDGDSLAPLLKKPKAPFRKTTLTMFDKGNASVRDQRYRYLKYNDGSEELYDLQKDANEWTNLANDSNHAKQKSQLQDELRFHVARLQPKANRVASSQLKWVGVYRKQENLPRPDAMLVNNDPEPKIGSDFANLYNGKDLSGWKPQGGTCRFEASGESIIGTCVPGSPSTYLCTEKTDYTDFIFTAELKHEVDGNTGVMFRASTKDGDGKNAGRRIVFGPQCEVEAYSKKRFWSGGIYGQSAGGWIYPMWLTNHNKTRESMNKQGKWNRITIKAQGDTIRTWLNGHPAAHWKNTTYKSGFFGLQIHAGKQSKIHFRNIKLKQL